MYLEFLILLSDYYKTIDKKIFIYEWLVPFLLGCLIFYVFWIGGSKPSTLNFNNNLVRLLAVLVGFSITIITILTTGNSKNLREIKETITDKKINGKQISLFHLLIVNFTYTAVVEILMIIFCLLYPLILDKIVVPEILKFIGFSILVALTVHVLLLSIRNLTDFCLVITKE